MATIPQRELRNDISRVLRRAENGERIVVTVDGRPVAELGPLGDRPEPATFGVLRELVADDADALADLERLRAEDRERAAEPWQ